MLCVVKHTRLGQTATSMRHPFTVFEVHFTSTIQLCLTVLILLDEDELDDCGPVPGRDPSNHDPPPAESTTVNLASTPTPSSIVKAPEVFSSERLDKRMICSKNFKRDLSRRWLYNTTIGEEYVNCTSSASEVSPGRNNRVYEFGQKVIPQCATWGDSNRTT
jgi:hypothetical protein